MLAITSLDNTNKYISYYLNCERTNIYCDVVYYGFRGLAGSAEIRRRKIGVRCTPHIWYYSGLRLGARHGQSRHLIVILRILGSRGRQRRRINNTKQRFHKKKITNVYLYVYFTQRRVLLRYGEAHAYYAVTLLDNTMRTERNAVTASRQLTAFSTTSTQANQFLSPKRINATEYTVLSHQIPNIIVT